MKLGSDDDASWIRVVVYEVGDGTIAKARILEDDPVASEAFFSRGS